MNRKALFSGSWYPESQNELNHLITTQIAKAQSHLQAHDKAKTSSSDAKISMAILPHAGLYYSSRGIAEYFARLSKTSTHFIILAPSHYARLMPNKLYYSDFDLLETPLGNIKIDAEMRSLFLSHSDLFSLHSEAVQKEHALEMFLPFIKQHEIAYGITCSASLLIVPELDSEHLNSLKKIISIWKGWFKFGSRKQRLNRISVRIKYYIDIIPCCSCLNSYIQTTSTIF